MSEIFIKKKYYLRIIFLSIKYCCINSGVSGIYKLKLRNRTVKYDLQNNVAKMQDCKLNTFCKLVFFVADT